jgi:sporulation protein YlmC with PRC-barrel domain
MNRVGKNSVLVLTGLALLGVALPSLSARADNVTQTVEMVRVDVQKLSTGYRASKIIGGSILNDAGETIGKIDDLIVSPDDNKSAYVILSVGGWLGMGTHLVALPYDNLRITSDKIVLPGATKEGLKTMPEFKYRTM